MNNKYLLKIFVKVFCNEKLISMFLCFTDSGMKKGEQTARTSASKKEQSK